MFGKGRPPPAPDYSGVAAAQKESAEIAAGVSREQLAWAREQFGQNKELMERVLDVQLPIMESEAEEGRALRERYNEVFQPIEDSLISESQEYASGARSDYDAGRAMASVSQSFDAARSNALARMESYGVDPSQTRAAALDSGIRVQEAAMKAAAGTQSRLNTENTGRALRGEAINIGRGLPSNIAGAYGTAMAAGQQGMGNALQTTQSGGNTMGTGNQWFGGQQQALGGWGNTIQRQHDGQMQHFNAKQQQSASMGSALGSLTGMALGAATGFFAEGGEVPHDSRDPRGKMDTIDAKLSGGEYVIPASAVRRLGSDRLDKLVAKYGDGEDRQAATHRAKTGAPGGEPANRRASAIALHQMRA